ncbi:MAG TPA: DUF4175 family protein [Gemmatimonadales bacterium]|nr:DUF4175 family protein [Gemmatimonadales bacterium]
MTPLQRVQRARRRLVVAIALVALCWAATAAMAVLIVATAGNAFATLPAVLRLAVIPAAALAMLVATGMVLWRGRAARSLEEVALWIEDRRPELRFALVTAIDPRVAPVEQHPALHAAAAAADIEDVVNRAWRRSLGWALLGVVLAGLLVAVLDPRALLNAARSELAERVGPKPAAPMANRLASIRAKVVPPAYTRQPATTIDQPNDIAALIGARITVGGSGPAEGVTGALGKDSLAASADGKRWALGVTMPKEPAVLTLRDRQYQRLLVLEPRTDSAPTVQLKLPANDTTYQTVPKGRLTLEASVGDDIGLAYGYFEYMLSTGSQESFETKLSTGPQVKFGNARAAMLRDVINLDTMKLAPGSVLHIRAVAFDFNDVTGPGKGTSETRTLRIAEPIDSTSINAAPPLPIDSMWISQRLLNMRTDTLIRNKRKLDRQDFVHKSSGYGNAQEDIRKRAAAVIAILEEDGVGGTFQTDASKMLREAVDLMFTAREHLSIAEPDSAMPYMKKILKILDDLRLAHRYYLRGLLKPVAVNIERVRLQGKDSAAAVARKPREALRDANAALAARIDVAAALARMAPAAAIDSLTYIRVSALTSAPAVAAPLRAAIEALQKGVSADSALAATRRALEPPAAAMASPLEWGGLAP